MTASSVAVQSSRLDVPGGTLLHPIVLLAIALFVVNDHVLKPGFGGWLPGKLSDVAGLVFFPVLIAALVELVAPDARRRRGEVLVAAACLTGLTYVGMLLVPVVADAYSWLFGMLQWPFRMARAVIGGAVLPNPVGVFFAADPTDLWTLPALVVPLALGIRLRRHPSS